MSAPQREQGSMRRASERGDILIANVISLRNSTRRGLVLERASRAGLLVHFHDAVDASGLSLTSDLAKSASDTFMGRYGRSQSLGELACLLSHMKLYSELLDLHEGPYVILEDDFYLLGDVGEIHSVIRAMNDQGVDVVILGYSKVDDDDERAINICNPLMESSPVFSTGRRIGFRCIETTCGAVSFICNNRFLRIASTSIDYGRLADDWAYYRDCGVSIGHLQPLIFREDYRVLRSDLEDERAMNSTLLNQRKIRIPQLYREQWRQILGGYRKIRYKLNRLRRDALFKF
jgi:GR25 family glycosyltransferase involved in LPS biosynthesis